jgi:hypothetical protein
VFKYIVFRLDVMVPVYLLPAFFVVSWKPHGARVTKTVLVVGMLAIIIPILRHNAFTPSVVAAERRQGRIDGRAGSTSSPRSYRRAP